MSNAFTQPRWQAIAAARRWSARIVDALAAEVASADGNDLFRISPLRWAAAHGISDNEAIDLFLHAARHGIFAFDWQLVCPMCSDTVRSFTALNALESHFHCPLCQTSQVGAADESIIIGFTVTPAARAIAQHDPASLSCHDYAFHYKGSVEGYTADGTRACDRIRNGLLFLDWLPAGQTAVHRVEVGWGVVLAFDMDSDAGFALPAMAEPTTEEQLVAVDYRRGKCELAVQALQPGPVRFEITNRDSERGLLGASLLPPGERQRLQFPTALFANRVLTHQTYRDLFRSDVVREGESVAVRDMCLLFTDLKGSTELYDAVGDVQAFALVGQHFDVLARITAANSGSVVKTIGDAVMAAFAKPADGVRAALAMIEQIADFNRQTGSQQLILKVGLHRGPSIAVAQNERLDYFGQTVNVAARVQGLAGPEEICITQAVADAPGVAELLVPLPCRTEKVFVKGVKAEQAVVRIAAG